MSDGALLHVQVAGRDLLLATEDLREVVVPSRVTPIPGGPAGLLGVVVHQGEFLPVLDWKDLPGDRCPAAQPVALAVLRPRLGLPIERLIGPVDVPAGGWLEVTEADPWHAVLGGVAEVEGRPVPLLDSDRLLALLRRSPASR